MKKINLEIKSVCNLSRRPIAIANNPIKLAAVNYIERSLKSNNFVDSTSSIEKILTDYYDSLSYKTLNDLFGTEIKKLDAYQYHNIFLPWYHTSPVLKFKDFAFIKNISKDDISKKSLKILKLIQSIKKEGYVPEEYKDRKKGHITGYHLEDANANKKFYVVSGNHRISILSALDYKQVSVLNESTSFFKERDRLNFNYKELPNVFSEKNVENWPSVQSGFLQKKDAIEILRKFTEV